jgi:hypothetical protein
MDTTKDYEVTGQLNPSPKDLAEGLQSANAGDLERLQKVGLLILASEEDWRLQALALTAACDKYKGTEVERDLRAAQVLAAGAVRVTSKYGEAIMAAHKELCEMHERGMTHYH